LVRDGTVIACAALHDHPKEKVMELACVAVHPDYQNQSMGEMLYKSIEALANNNGVKMLLVFTTQTEHWFIERGFVEMGVSSLPIEKQETYNYQRNSKILVKRINV
jgi:amino-acid N-acetyltransferase